MSGLVYIVSAPSGSGKSTLVNEVRKAVPNLEFSISYTTRKPRGSEQNGREYYFITRDEFERMIKADDFLEYAEVFGNYYGTAKRFMREAHARGNDLLLDIDVQGERQIRERLPEAVSIFIMPPSRKVLEQRLRRRSQAEGSDSEEVIQRRLLAAAKEIENYGNYSYILVNDRLEESIDHLRAIVLAERIKHSGQKPSAEDEQILRTAEKCLQANVRTSLHTILDTFYTPDTPR